MDESTLTEVATRPASSTGAAATVLVRYFAAAAEAAGVEEERIALAGPDAATLGAVRDLLVARYGPAMARVVANGSFLVDGIVRRDPTTLIGAQVDVLPPFAGG